MAKFIIVFVACCIPVVVFLLRRKGEERQSVEGQPPQPYAFHKKPSLEKFRKAMFDFFPRGARESELHSFHRELEDAFHQFKSGCLRMPKLAIQSFLKGVSEEFKPYVQHLNTVSQASSWYENVQILEGQGEILGDEDDFFEEYEAMYIIALVLIVMSQVSNWTSSHVICIQKPFYDNEHDGAFYVEAYIKNKQVHFRHATSHAYCRYYHLRVDDFPV